eukprot:13335884-Alexandrium_andersonii.AAC.1
MSASLVGSEMCIRDRALRAGPQGWPQGLWPPGLKAGPQGWPPRLALRACLLYTSDAADDM